MNKRTTKCKICDHLSKSHNALSYHIKSEHEIGIKEYFDKYYHSEKECITCGKETTFINIVKGYRKYCSKECSLKNKLLIINRTEKANKTNAQRYGKQPSKNRNWKNKTHESGVDRKISKEVATKRFEEMGFELVSEYINTRTKVVIKCYCGNIFSVRPDKIWNGHTKSCGCLECPNLIDKKIGKLTVISRAENGKVGRWWNCLCECGGNKEVITACLLSGSVSSCGCLVKRTKENHPGWKGFHGISGSFWISIKSSAESRGFDFNITIEDAWKKFVEQSGKCALTGVELSLDKSSDNPRTASLDRIDSNKGYSIDNIQWVHKTINIIKMDLSVEELLYWCDAITKFNKEKIDETDRKQITQDNNISNV